MLKRSQFGNIGLTNTLLKLFNFLFMYFNVASKKVKLHMWFN